MALELAELSRLDMACNLKDWRRAVIESARARPDVPARLPDDWAFEVQIALNCLLISCVREAHGRAATLLVRHAFEQTLLEQVATAGASLELLERVATLQSLRFATFFAALERGDPDPDSTALPRRLAQAIVARETPTLADPLAASFEEFRSAMAKRVATYALAEGLARVE